MGTRAGAVGDEWGSPAWRPRRAALASGLSMVALVVGAVATGAAPAAAGPRLGTGGCQVPSSTCARLTGSAEALGLGSWSVLPGAPLEARSGEAAVWTGTDLLMWGGESTTTRDDGLPETEFANGAAYDVATRNWHMMPNSPLVESR